VTPVGLVVALPGELRTLTKERIKTGRWLRLNENTLTCLSGVGPGKAAAAASGLIEQGCNALVSWGCAAAISAELKAGDLIVPERVLSATGEAFETDCEWRSDVLERLADRKGVHAGAITEARTLVATAADKRSLRNQTGAVALDMESAAIARIAARQNIPFMTIRAVADPACMDLPKPVAIALNPDGDVRLALLLALTACNPGSIPGLVRLGLCFRAAQHRLRLSARQLENDFYRDPARD
jgi:adenosylhomocysteine nucleosidase